MDDARALPVGSVGIQQASGWWGMVFVVLTEASLIVYLLFSYFYYAVRTHAAWPTGGLPPLGRAIGSTVLLLLSAAALWWAERGITREDVKILRLGVLLALLLGIGFIGLEIWECLSAPFTAASDLYGSIFFVISYVHLAHAVVGIVALSCLLLWSSLGLFDAGRHTAVSITALYWRFVVAIWLPVFATLYLTPYLL